MKGLDTRYAEFHRAWKNSGEYRKHATTLLQRLAEQTEPVRMARVTDGISNMRATRVLTDMAAGEAPLVRTTGKRMNNTLRWEILDSGRQFLANLQSEAG